MTHSLTNYCWKPYHQNKNTHELQEGTPQALPRARYTIWCLSCAHLAVRAISADGMHGELHLAML